MDKQCHKTDSVLSYVNKENGVNCISDATCKNKQAENEKEAKTSKIISLLNPYSDVLNESADFVECELTNKFKNASQKHEKKEFQTRSQVNEVMVCEICKEDITSLDIHNRGIHVNKCIDKQISSASEQVSSPSEIAFQPSSSDDVFILECPLCFKHFSSPELRSNHIKKCGRSKGLCLQSILKALELQERHALERISLGLPAKPVKPVKVPKTSVNKKAIVQPKNKTQSDIQLAKALSLSLTSSSQMNDTENNEQITAVILKPPAPNQRPGKKTKKVISTTPLLVLRSDEDRKKLLLEKVENILTSAIEISSDTNETGITEDKQTTLNQEVLTLWHLSSKSFDKCEYYVEELLDWIKPSDVEVGAKLLHLSQIPGHEIVTQLPCEYTFNTPEEKNDTDFQTSIVTSVTNQYSSSVIDSLSLLVASSWMSDVDIHTACGTLIPAHKLLLAIRCPPLKQDFDFCSGKERASLKWENISFDAALQFLNFIYTGNIDIKRNMIYELLYLANKYEVFDLQTVLHANNIDNSISETKTNQNILSAEKELGSLSSSHHIETENTDNTLCESQENMDLEIVYNCINSTLKPSQPVNSQLPDLSDTSSYKYIQITETKNDNAISDKLDNDERVSVSNYSEQPFACCKFSPKNNSSTSSVIFDVNDSENDTDNLLSEKGIIGDNFSPKNDGSASPVVFDVNDSENEADDILPENNRSTSPVIFDINDSENDADNFSDNGTTDCVINCSQKSASGAATASTAVLDLNTVESNSSEDSVKFLQSSYASLNNTCNTPERIRKSISFSPKYSEMISFSQRLKESFQNSPTLSHDNHDGKITRGESNYESLGNAGTELKSSSLPCFPILNEKRFYLTPEKCSKLHDVELDSSVASCSKRLISNFYSGSDDKTSDVTETKDDLKSFNRDSFADKSLINESSKIINLVGNENITDINSVAGKHNGVTLKSPIKNSPSQSNPFSAKPDNNAIEVSPIRTFSSPKMLICDSDCDSKSRESIHYKASPLKEYCTAFSPKNININSLAKSSLSSNKSSEGDTVFESFHYFDTEISLLNEDKLQSNTSKYAGEKVTSPTEVESFKYSETTEKEHAISVTDCLKKPPKTLKHVEKEKISKTVTPSNKPETMQPRFQISDSPVTPFPDYKTMMTPEITKALKRIGVKPLKRKKAIAILSHVYNETHPLIDAETNTVSISETTEIQSNKMDKVNKSKKRKQTTQNSEKPVKKQQKENHSSKAVLASPESDESGSENPEWVRCVPEMSFSQSNHDSPTKPSKDDIESIKSYIQSNEELYYDILNYKPLNLVELHQELKRNDIKISIQKLMDFLDEQCITFTCPRNEEYKKKQTARQQRFRKNMIAKLSQKNS